MMKKNTPSISTLTEEIDPDSARTMETVTAEHRVSGISKRELLWVTVATLAALALRIFMLRYAARLTSDGAWYAILGQNLISGDFQGGLSAYWPPLYPFLIGVTSLIVEDLEWAGRAVSAISGGLLVVPVYFLARRLYGKTEAGIAAFLVIICPPLVVASTPALTESLYTLLFTLAIAVVVSALIHEKRWLFFAGGVVFALCYLVKPEAIGFVALIIVAALGKRLFIKNADVKSLVAGALLAFAGFAIVSLPYVLYLHDETGRWSVSEKLTGSFGLPDTKNKWRGLIENGQTTLADKLWSVGSSRALGEEAAESGGVHAQPGEVTSEPAEVIAESAEVATESVEGAAESESAAETDIPLRIPQPRYVVRNLYIQYINLVTKITPPLFFLAGLGLVGTAWYRGRTEKEAYLFIFVGSTLVGYSVVGFITSRYLVVLIPIVICWSARGVLALESCIANIEEEVRQSEGFLRRHPKVLRTILLACLVGLLAPSLIRFAGVKEGAEKDIAGWIKQDSAPTAPVIMASGPLMAFYSEGRHLYIPAEEYNTVIEYASRKGVDYLVVEERMIGLNPRLRFLLNDKEDHPGLELVYRNDAPRQKVRVFKLTRPGKSDDRPLGNSS